MNDSTRAGLGAQGRTGIIDQRGAWGAALLAIFPRHLQFSLGAVGYLIFSTIFLLKKINYLCHPHLLQQERTFRDAYSCDQAIKTIHM